MTDSYTARNLEPTVIGAVWRYRWMVAGVIIGFAVVGILIANSLPERWSAEAEVVVEDPNTSGLLVDPTGTAQRPDRYVQNQAAIIQSEVVAQAAVESAENVALVTPLEINDLLGGISVSTSRDSDVIKIRYTADDRDTALVAVNTVAAAYEARLAEQSAANFAAAIAQIDSAIEDRNIEIKDLETQINAQLLSDPTREALLEQFESALAELTRLQAEVLSATEEQLPIIRAQLDDILQQIQTIQAVSDIDRTRPEVKPLLDQQNEAVQRLSELAALRDNLRVDAQLAGTGVAIKDEAQNATPARTRSSVSAVVFGLLGAVIGASAAYFLALRRRRFRDRNQPELVLGAPAIAEVPSFRQEGVKSPLPVRTSPRSASAEAFRFAASALYSGRTNGSGSVGAHRTIAVTSAKVGEGKTVVAANTALAVARSGKRVLLVDADFGSQMTTSLVVPNVRPEKGFTEVVEEGIPLSEAVIPVEGSTDGAHLHLLARGWRRTSAPEFLSLPGTKEFLARAAETYDLVILDTPPLLQVAYASAIVGLVDAALLVVPHGGNVADLEQVADRLELLDTRPLGYVYNLAPLRGDMTATEGSMVDVLGHSN